MNLSHIRQLSKKLQLYHGAVTKMEDLGDTKVPAATLTDLVALFKDQAEEARAREKHLATLVEKVIASTRPDTSPVATDNSAVFTRAAPGKGLSLSKAECPLLSSTASLAEFVAWKDSWDDLYQCRRLEEWDTATQIAALKSCFDEELRRYIRENIIDVGKNPDVLQLINAVELYIRGQRNPLLDRIEFYRLQQDDGETFNSFFTSLKELYKASTFKDHSLCHACQDKIASCSVCQGDFHSHEEETLRDRIVTGIRNDETRHKLLAEFKLTLQRAIEICRAEETANVTEQSICTPPQERIQAIRKRSNYQRMKFQPRKPVDSVRAPAIHAPAPVMRNNDSSELCSQCGYKQHQELSHCPANGKQCILCGETGHFRRVCRNKHRTARGHNGVLSLRLSSIQGSDTVDLQTTLECSSDTAWEPTDIAWLPDTGSDVDAIGPDTLYSLGGSVESLSPDYGVVRSADGQVMNSLGKVPALLEHQGCTRHTELHVYKDVAGPLLSRQSLKALKFLPEDWPHDTTVGRTVLSAGHGEETITENDRKQLLMKEFSDVFEDQFLQPMKGPPMTIRMQDDAKPFCITAARAIPHAYRDQIKSQLDDMVRNNIIEPVTEPSDWCHPIVTVPKRGTDERRLTVDLTQLNRQVKRPVHPMKSVKDAIADITGAKYFTLLDARHGYWQVPLAEESRSLTTFITPWGRYQYLRNPQGFIGAGDEFNLRTDAAFAGIENMAKVVDDCLIFDDDLDKHTARVRQVLQRAREHGITLSPRKFVFAQSEVNFCGFTINTVGWQIDKGKLQAIQDFPVPQNITDLRSFTGLVNQFAEFSPSLATLTEPLRALLAPSNEFRWEDHHSVAMNNIKKELLQAPTLAFYQFGAPTRLETDASRQGIGFVLLQNQGGHWRLIQCGSRFLSASEGRYAMIELECLAVVWAMKKCYPYLAGVSFDLVTDHKPLVPILNKYTLDQVENPRLLRLLLKIQDFQFSATWRKGKDHFIADALSRFPVGNPSDEDEFGEVESSSGACISLLSISDQHGIDDDGLQILPDMKHQHLREVASEDPEYKSLLIAIEDGFPHDSQDLPNALRPYWKIRDQLSAEDGLALKGHCIIIPRSLRGSVLKDLHSSHQGQARTKRRARQVVYWPYINNDIDNVIRQCAECRKRLPSLPKEPLRSDPIPEFPFQYVGTDLFACEGRQFLVYTDRLSGWSCVERLGATANARDVIKPLRRWFADVGVPKMLRTDGGPRFASRQFEQFCKRWQVRHQKSTPHYPQSNGLAEAAVKAVKDLIYKTSVNGDLDLDSFQRGLLELRNTPRLDGRSPAQILYGRPLSSFIVANHRAFSPGYQLAAEKADLSRSKYQQKAEQHYNQSAHTLKNLPIGTTVDVQDFRTKQWNLTGVIVAIGKNRDYIVRLPSGRAYWRNRRFLRPCIPSFPSRVVAAPPQISSPLPTDQCPSAEPVNTQSDLRHSSRARRQFKPMNITSTRCKSYD